jgi:glutamate racemase
MDNQPIGIFDSGIGGTSIWKEIHNLLPNEKPYILQIARTLLMAKIKRRDHRLE